MKKIFISSVLVLSSFLSGLNPQNSYAIDLKEELNNIQNQKQETQNKLRSKLTKRNFFNILRKRYYTEKKVLLKQKTLLLNNAPFMAFDEDGKLINTGSLPQDLSDTPEIKKIKLEAWYVISMILVNNYKLKLTTETNNEVFLKQVFELFRNFSDSAVKYYIELDDPLSKVTKEDLKNDLLSNLEKINELKTKYKNSSNYSSLRDPLYNFALDFNSFLESIEKDYITQLNLTEERQEMRKIRNMKK